MRAVTRTTVKCILCQWLHTSLRRRKAHWLEWWYICTSFIAEYIFVLRTWWSCLLTVFVDLISGRKLSAAHSRRGPYLMHTHEHLFLNLTLTAISFVKHSSQFQVSHLLQDTQQFFFQRRNTHRGSDHSNTTSADRTCYSGTALTFEAGQTWHRLFLNISSINPERRIGHCVIVTVGKLRMGFISFAEARHFTLRNKVNRR